jgi:predicted protein tyrosine phosphatase
MLIGMSELEPKKRVLFVCTQNKVRSLTAEHLYRVRPDLEVKSCGTATFAKNQLTSELLQWAEVVFYFDDSQLEVMERHFREAVAEKPVICLGLADIFTYKSDALVVKLTTKLDPYLGRPTAKKLPRNSALATVKPGLAAAKKPAGSASRSLVANLLAAVGVGAKKRSLSK